MATVLAPGHDTTDAARLVLLDDPPNRLMRRAADRCRTPEATHLSIGGQYVHPFPRVLH